MDEEKSNLVAGRVSILSYVMPLPSSYQSVLRSVSRLIIYVCNFLLVYKIVYGRRTFSDASVSVFLHQTFPDLQDNKIRSVNIRLHCSYCKLCKRSIFQVVSLRKMRVFKRFLFVVLIANFKFAGFRQKRSVWRNPNQEGTDQNARILPYNKVI